MAHVDGVLQGPVRLDEDTTVMGMVQGDVTVPPGIRLVVHGMVEGDVIVEAGGHAEVHGMITGELRET